MVSIVGVNLALCLFFIQLETVTSSGFKCGDDGFYANPDECLKFISCSKGQRMDFDCPKGTSWYADRGVCDTADSSKCATKATPAPSRPAPLSDSDSLDPSLQQQILDALKKFKPCNGGGGGDSGEDSSEGTTRHYHPTTGGPNGGNSGEDGDSSEGTTRAHRHSTPKPTASPGDSDEDDNSSEDTPRPRGSSTQKPSGSTDGGDSGEDHHPPRNHTTRSPDNSGSSTTAGSPPSTLPPPTCPACPIPTEKACPAALTCPACPTQQPNTCPPAPTCPPPPPQPTCPACPTAAACPAAPTCPPPPKCPTCPVPTEKVCPTVQSCPTTTPQPPKPICDNGWKYYEATKSCYLLGVKQVNNIDAQSLCRAQGALLASIHNAAENTFIYQYAQAASTASPFNPWIGAYRTGNTAANFANFDGTPLDYKNFNGTQPDNYLSNEFCTEMYIRSPEAPDAFWNDRNCAENHPAYVCKKAANV